MLAVKNSDDEKIEEIFASLRDLENVNALTKECNKARCKCVETLTISFLSRFRWKETEYYLSRLIDCGYSEFVESDFVSSLLVYKKMAEESPSLVRLICSLHLKESEENDRLRRKIRELETQAESLVSVVSSLA
jgi:hypothetical protein